MDTPTARTALLFANFSWFGAGFYQFTMRSRQAFLKGIRRKPGDATPTHADHAADIFRYLGAMGGALALSNLPQLAQALSSSSSTLGTRRAREATAALPYLFLVWGAAHASQAVTTLSIVAPSGRWRWEGRGLGMITYIDVALWAANWAVWWWS